MPQDNTSLSTPSVRRCPLGVDSSIISKNLKDFNCFVPCDRNFIDGKKPILRSKENDWNDHLVSYEDASSCIYNNQNIGLCAGHGLIILDCDSPELVELANRLLPKTYEETTPSGGIHLIYRYSGKARNRSFNIGEHHLGELRCNREFVIIAPSVAQSKIDKKFKPYMIVNDVSPAELSEEQLKFFLENFPEDAQSNIPIKTTGGVKTKKEHDRSAYDFARCCQFIEMGLSFTDVCDKMREFGSSKWHERGPSYQKLTYLAARRRVGKVRA